MKKKKITLGLIILVLMGITIASFFTTSNGYTEYKNNQRWYYEVVDGEAVNVRIVDYDDSQTTITVPSELGGYPVKSIAGYVGAEKVLWEDGFGSSTVGYLNSSKVNYSMFSVMGESNRALVDKIPLVTEIILPEGLKSIGYGAFYNCKNLETVNIPDSVEEIGDYAFWATDVKTLVLDGVSIGKNAFDYSAIENLTIKNTDLNNDTIFYNNSNALKNLTIGEGVTEVTNVGQLPRDTNVQISDDVETIKRDAMFGVSDVYVNNYKANVTVQEPTLLTNRCPYIHFLDGETISTSTLEASCNK